MTVGIFSMSGILVWASNPRLVTARWNTWAENHSSGYLSDTYRGELSINGFEDYVERGVSKYPKWIQITYNVQGTISKESAYAQGGDTNRLISPMSVSNLAKD